MSSPIMQAIKQISDEKNISVESVIETIEAALAAAYRKDFGTKNQNIKVAFEAESGGFEVFDVKTVVEDMELPEEEEGETVESEKRPAKEAEAVPVKRVVEAAPPAEEKKAGEAGAADVRTEGEEEPEKKFNPRTEIMISEAKATLKKDAEIGEEIRTKLDVPAAFGRMAAQTAKQVITQKLREAERSKMFNELKEREHELINATVQRCEGRLVLIDLGRVTAIMPPEEQIPNEHYEPGARIKVYIVEVRPSSKGPEVIVSRSHPEIVRKLFALEIPEVASGVVQIHAVAREAGSRSKVAVSSSQENVDPIGSCIGQRGTRIQTVIVELGGEKVDIIQHDDDPEKFIMNALSPAKVIEIALNEDDNIAEVIVAEDQLSLAIGRGGQNVRLASKLTGWRINIKTLDSAEESGTTVLTAGEETEEEAAGPQADDAVSADEEEMTAESPDAAEGGSAEDEEAEDETAEAEEDVDGEDEKGAADEEETEAAG